MLVNGPLRFAQCDYVKKSSHPKNWKCSAENAFLKKKKPGQIKFLVCNLLHTLLNLFSDWRKKKPLNFVYAVEAEKASFD